MIHVFRSPHVLLKLAGFLNWADRHWLQLVNFLRLHSVIPFFRPTRLTKYPQSYWISSSRRNKEGVPVARNPMTSNMTMGDYSSSNLSVNSIVFDIGAKRSSYFLYKDGLQPSAPPTPSILLNSKNPSTQPHLTKI